MTTPSAAVVDLSCWAILGIERYLDSGQILLATERRLLGMTLGGLKVSAQIVSQDLTRGVATCGDFRRYRLIGEPVSYSADQIAWAVKFLEPLRVEVELMS